MSLYHQRINSLWMSIFLSGALSACSASNENRILTVDLGIPVRSPGVSTRIDPRLEKLFSINVGSECYQDQIFLLSRNRTTGATIELKKLPLKSTIVNNTNINYDNTSSDIDNVIQFLKNQTTLDSTPTIAAPRTEKIEVGIIGQFAKPQDTNRDGICDPQDNTLNNVWIKSTDLLTNVYSHTANLLPNGKIMVIGGIGEISGSQAAVNTVQLFDPSTRQWTSTTPLLTARYDHTATALRDGRVVVIGGKTSTGTTPSVVAQNSSIEIYTPGSNDATAGTWSTQTSPPASFTANLYGHTATLLPDQRILIVGGNAGGSNSISQAGIYDPTNNSWQTLDVLNEGRESHATILKNGKIVVVGGKKLQGGSTTYPTSNLVADFSGGKTVSNALEKRIGMGVVDLDEKSILIVGGMNDQNNIIVSNEQFDIESGGISAHSSLATASSDHATIKLPGGYILNAGGSSSNGAASATTQVFEPSTSTAGTFEWRIKTPTLNQARKKFAAVALNDGTVMITGGCTGTGATCNPLTAGKPTVETFVPFNAASYTTSVIGHTSVDTNSMVGDSVMINLQVLHSNPTGDYGGTNGAPNLSSFQGKKDWMSIPISITSPTCQMVTGGSFSACPIVSTVYVTDVRYFKNDNDLLVKSSLKTSIGSNPPNNNQYYLPHAKQTEVFFELYSNSTSCMSSPGNTNGFCGRYKAYLDENYSGTVTATLVSGYYHTNNTPIAIQGTFNRTFP